MLVRDRLVARVNGFSKFLNQIWMDIRSIFKTSMNRWVSYEILEIMMEITME